MKRDHASMHILPDSPGVYFFMGVKKNVLYVGKASSLKDRVRSYFSSDLIRTRGAHIVAMVEQAIRVEYRATDSVLEALILEAKLIKNFKPPHNIRDKDDKSFNYLVITMHEEYPRLLTVRGKDIETTLHELRVGSRDEMKNIPVYGPFPHAGQFKEALKLIRKIFPYYDTRQSIDVMQCAHHRNLRFNESIGIYPPASTTPREYARTIRHIRLLFDGKKPQLIRRLEQDMKQHARAQRFEEAAKVKRQVFALQHINDVSLIRRSTEERGTVEAIRIEGYDVAHLGGKYMVGVMTVVEGREVQKKEYRTFSVRSVTKSNDTQALTEILSRRLGHPEWSYPKLIVVDGGRAQLNAARTVLHTYGVDIPVVAVTKDERHRPRTIQGPIKIRDTYQREILLVNAEAHRFSLALHRKKRSKHIVA